MAVDVPRLHSEGFPFPRVETPERPGTDHGVADQVLDWIAVNAPGPPLLPWERYVIWRGLETVQGRLWRNVAFLVSRQQGKTFLMQRLMLARLHLADLLGSPAILNTHPDVSQAVELVETFARDAESGYLRARANGADWWIDAESVVDIGKGRVWRARAQTRGAITGQAGVGMVFVDEVQSARQPVIDRTVRPILSGSRVVNPQAWFAGTGERDDSEVLRQLRGAGARGGDTLWLEWSAPPGCATDDEVAWWWASPDWSENRRQALASDLHHMQEVDFRSEYLVQHDAQVTLWMPRPVVAECGRPVVAPAPLVGALEVSSDQVSWSGAVSDGLQVATLVGRSLPEVVGWLAGHAPPVVLGHQSVCARPELARLGVELRPVKVHEVAAAAAELGDAVRGGLVEFDHPDEVGSAFARVVIGRVDGLRRIVDSQSRGDVSVVKAMSWAFWWARQNAPEPSMVF